MYKGEPQPGELKDIFYELMMTDIVRGWLSGSSWEDVKKHMKEKYNIAAGKFDEYFKEEDKKDEGKNGQR